MGVALMFVEFPVLRLAAVWGLCASAFWYIVPGRAIPSGPHLFLWVLAHLYFEGLVDMFHATAMWLRENPDQRNRRELTDEARDRYIAIFAK
jgi:hypothetical protein